MPITLAPQTFISTEYTPNAQGQIIGLDKTGGSSSTSGLLQINDFTYEGAFRIDGGIHGSNDPLDSVRYQQRAIIALNKSNGNLLINGHGDFNSRNIGEFSIPALVNETGGNFGNLNMATSTQDFSNILSNLPVNNDPDNSGISISGIYEQDGEIVVNYFSLYDNQTPYNTEFCAHKASSTNISATNDITGAFTIADAAHFSGWMSDIPAEWQAALGGTHLRGHSAGNTRTINARHSNGPSAAVFNMADLLSPNTPASGAALTHNIVLDYPLANFMGSGPGDNADDLNNAGQIWTTFSEAGFGFIIPGTDTYAVFGYSGGHSSGITYGIPPYSPSTPQGFYTVDQDDRYNYYWFFDVNDLVDVRNGVIQPYEVVPYDHGSWDIPFGGVGRNFNNITGGAYDAANNRLYLTLSGADNQDALGNVGGIPMVVAFTVGGGN